MSKPRRGGGRSSRSPRATHAAVLLLAVLAAATALALPGRAVAAPRGALLSARALEARHGLRITRVAVVGGGGMVDLRYQVVDREKARPLLAGHASPRLVVLPAGKVLTSPEHHGSREGALRDGTSLFVLFPNAGNAVKRGGRVSVAFGDLRVEPVAVQ